MANLGPLTRLAGVWEGRKGVDLNPKADGPERREFLERTRDASDRSAGQRAAAALRPALPRAHRAASDEDSTFHDQIGYWLWEPASGLIMQSVTIPRGPGRARVRASPKPDDEDNLRHGRSAATRATASAQRNSWTKHFAPTSYRCDITFNDDGSWTYDIRTDADGPAAAPNRFDHHDTNTLKLVEAPQPNPLARILSERAKARTNAPS